MTQETVEEVLERLTDAEQVNTLGELEMHSDDQQDESIEPSLETDDNDEQLADLLSRINRMADAEAGDEETSDDVCGEVESTALALVKSQLNHSPTGAEAESAGSLSGATDVADDAEFFPQEPASLRKAGLTESEVEQLILKSLLGRGESSGRDIADQVKLPFVLIDDLLRRMKYDQLLSYRDSAPMNDYIYEMTEVGRERGRRFSEACSYYGAAPVVMEDYIRSVKAQSLETQHPTVE